MEESNLYIEGPRTTNIPFIRKMENFYKICKDVKADGPMPYTLMADVEKCLGLNYEQFSSALNSVKEIFDWSVRIYDCGIEVFSEIPQDGVQTIIKLLEYGMSDTKNHYIAFWCFELDFGRKCADCMIKHNGKNIQLKTAYDLWKLLISEIAESVEMKNEEI